MIVPRLFSNLQYIVIHHSSFRPAERCADCLEFPGCVENDDHIIQCTAGLRLEAKRLWLKDVKDYLFHNSYHDQFNEILWVGIQSFINGTDPETAIQAYGFVPPALLQAYNDQSQIGWDHSIRGRVSILWQLLIREHMQHNPPDRSVTSKEWMIKMIVVLWKGVLLLWDIQNKIVHGHNSETQQSAEHERLMKEAKYLQQQGTTVDAQDQHWFNVSEAQLNGYTVTALKGWLRNARMVIRLHYMEQKSKLKPAETATGIQQTQQTDKRLPLLLPQGRKRRGGWRRKKRGAEQNSLVK